MKRLRLLTSSLALLSRADCQQVDVTINHLATQSAYISIVSGERISPIDSVVSSDSGEFIFKLPPGSNRGVYRLSVDKNKWMDFVNDGEDVTISTDARTIIDSLKVSLSESSRLYHAFQKLNKQYKNKSELLQLVLSRYPRDDPYYRTTETVAGRLQKEYLDFVDTASQARAGSFIARYIRSSQLPVIDFSQSFDKQLVYLKAHALDHVTFYDDGLIFSDVFTNKTIEYLTYYHNAQLPKKLLEREFEAAVDTILNKAKVNQIVYKHITEYLIDGFKQFGFTECIDYILENYVIKDGLCLDEGSGSTIQRMIDQKKSLRIGAQAPDITLPDTSGDLVSLESIKAKRIAVVFYLSSCPHCQAIIPRLSEFAKTKEASEFKVLAISLDSSRADWVRFIRFNALTWTNLNEPEGWRGRAARDYFIYATPTIIVFNMEKKVIGMPLTIEDLRKLL